ncbi:MAG: response regulator transcription factor [Thermodesulfobacteriota bacterium]
MANEHILIIEDEEDILELISYNLQYNGFSTTGINSGEKAAAAVRAKRPDLIILDLMLPGIDGFEVCRLLKQDESSRDIPLVMLTAKGEDSDIIAGLELGADDYITKPFSPQVLIARLRAILRRKGRHEQLNQGQIKQGDLLIDTKRHEISLGGQLLNLTKTEFLVLHYLANRPGWVFTRKQIVAEIHQDDFSITERAIDVQIAGLRKKLGINNDLIETIRGVGYRFRDIGK